MRMHSIRVMIVDDHNLVREGLKAVFDQGDEVDVVGEAGSGEEAIEMVGKVEPDVVLMDISMPGMNGIQATKLIRDKYPGVKVVILTMLDQEGYVYEAVKAAADRARKQGEPGFLEIKTYRYKGHSMSDPAKYRTKEELAEYRRQDPILILKDRLTAAKQLTEEAYKKMDDACRREAEEAAAFAEQSPEPPLETLYEDVLV